MARRCEITNKGLMSGNKRSHALNATRRVWKPNLQKISVCVNGKKQTMILSTKALRTLKKNNQICKTCSIK